RRLARLHPPGSRGRAPQPGGSGSPPRSRLKGATLPPLAPPPLPQHPMKAMPASGRRELAVVLLVAAVQFVNILGFVMVMPMGPDFAAALHPPASRLGLIGGSYTAAASVAGLASSLFLDRFDRRPALGISMLGLVAGTALGGFATDMTSLMIARMVAGAFGGPATSL